MRVMWDYNDENYSKEEIEFELLAPGEYQVRITAVDYMKSKTGKDMFVVKVEPLDSNASLRYYLTFDPEKTKMTDQFLGRIYDSFNMDNWGYDQKSDTENWVGCWGAAEIIQEEYTDKTGNKKMSNKIKRFLTQERQIELGFSKQTEDIKIPF